MVLIGFCVDVSSFLGEFRAERDDRLHTAKEILDWALLGAEVLELFMSDKGCIAVSFDRSCILQSDLKVCFNDNAFQFQSI